MVDIDIDWKFLAADGLEIAPSRASEERHGDRVSPDGSGNRVTYRMFSGFLQVSPCKIYSVYLYFLRPKREYLWLLSFLSSLFPFL